MRAPGQPVGLCFARPTAICFRYPISLKQFPTQLERPLSLQYLIVVSSVRLLFPDCAVVILFTLVELPLPA